MKISTSFYFIVISDKDKIITHDTLEIYEHYSYYEEEDWPKDKFLKTTYIKHDNICALYWNSVFFNNKNCLYELLDNGVVKEIFEFPHDHYIKKISYGDGCLYVLCETNTGSVVYYNDFITKIDFKKLNIQYNDIEDIIVDNDLNNNEIILKRPNGFLIKNNNNLTLNKKYNIPINNKEFINVDEIYAKDIIIDKDIYIIDKDNYCYVFKKDENQINCPYYECDEKTYLGIGKILDIRPYRMKSYYFIDLDGNLKCCHINTIKTISKNVKFKKIVKVNNDLLFISDDDSIYTLTEKKLLGLKYENCDINNKEIAKVIL